MKPGLNSREWMLHWADVLLGLAFVFALAGLLVASAAYWRAARVERAEGIAAVETRLRMVESKVYPMAYVWRCDECQTVIATDSENTPVCGGCGHERRFCFVGKNSE